MILPIQPIGMVKKGIDLIRNLIIDQPTVIPPQAACVCECYTRTPLSHLVLRPRTHTQHTPHKDRDVGSIFRTTKASFAIWRKRRANEGRLEENVYVWHHRDMKTVNNYGWQDAARNTFDGGRSRAENMASDNDWFWFGLCLPGMVTTERFVWQASWRRCFE